MRLPPWLCYLLAHILLASGLPPHLLTAVSYLRKFGYLDSDNSSPEVIAEALSAFQEEVGLGVSGELTPETLELMRQPRCGLPFTRRKKRFVPHTLKWPTNVLGWRLDDPYDLLRPYDKLVVRNTLRRALNEWTKGSRGIVQFEERKEEEPNDIEVFFATGTHNDSLPFDGKSGVVAHGFYPTQGKLHFDASEKWTLNMPAGINLYQTAVHEIGHLLGLEHSSDSGAVMFPINRAYDPKYGLGEDDKRGVRFLYSPWAWRFHWSRYVERLWTVAKKRNEPRKSRSSFLEALS